jgi:molybdate/tungstate transport system substrate-binding protein
MLSNKNYETDEYTKRLTIKHAGSLHGVFSEINDQFKLIYPDINVISNAGGSAGLARDIVKGADCDIFVSADYNLIPHLLYPNHAGWYIIFASSQMVLRYTNKSRYQDEINQDNWIEILQREGVTFWHSDANEDPGGYRTLMVLQLAEKYYNISNLFNRLMTPEHEHIATRTTLQESAKGYSFGYGLRSSHGMSKVLSLPDEINLSRKEFTGFYNQAEIHLPGNNPGEMLTLRGEPVQFGMTIPNTCLNREFALEWIRLLLGDTGKSMLEKAGLVPIRPAIAGDKHNIPNIIKSHVK